MRKEVAEKIRKTVKIISDAMTKWYENANKYALEYMANGATEEEAMRYGIKKANELYYDEECKILQKHGIECTPVEKRRQELHVDDAGDVFVANGKLYISQDALRRREHEYQD